MSEVNSIKHYLEVILRNVSHIMNSGHNFDEIEIIRMATVEIDKILSSVSHYDSKQPTLCDRLTEAMERFDGLIGIHLEDTVDQRDVQNLKDLLKDANEALLNSEWIAVAKVDSLLSVAEEVCGKVVSRYFDDSTSYSEEITSEFSKVLNDAVRQSPVKGMKVESLSSIGAIRKLIRGLPDDGMMHLQVSAEDGTTWNMGASGAVLNDRTACINMNHPQLKTLPKSDDDINNPNFYDNNDIDEVIGILQRMKSK